ncbi:Hypothetical predicted protein [Marmota monax]|uniref:Uncharacterized protein n=1 Tax=Marmota monax TaxID=9995 RepID=A0A5E4AF78_MARMO|nr:hypothetical protein GHT09_000979 [Marmota monax]VTJ55944.1 Hypothetical predicted protein [Marmota monax]
MQLMPTLLLTPWRLPGDAAPTAAAAVATAAIHCLLPATTPTTLPPWPRGLLQGGLQVELYMAAPILEHQPGPGAQVPVGLPPQKPLPGDSSRDLQIQCGVPVGLEEPGVFLLRALVALVLLLHLGVAPLHEWIPGLSAIGAA